MSKFDLEKTKMPGFSADLSLYRTANILNRHGSLFDNASIVSPAQIGPGPGGPTGPVGGGAGAWGCWWTTCCDIYEYRCYKPPFSWHTVCEWVCKYSYPCERCIWPW